MTHDPKTDKESAESLAQTSIAAPDGASAAAAQPVAANAQPTAPDHHKKPHRTLGLRLFDVFLYPFLTNFVVMALSVVATYLTSKGGTRNADGKLIYGEFGNFFQTRGDKFVGGLKWCGRKVGLNVNDKTTDMAKMVTFSFVDGSLIAPLVKLFEDRREKIAEWVDDRLGTAPADKSVYEAEPKQSWKSVLWGRAATFAIVFPTAVALDKIHVKGGNINDHLFNNPGQKMGEWISKKPELAKKFGSLEVPMLFKIGAFEAFYTSLCTTGLYFLSRFFADRIEHKTAEKIGHPPIANDNRETTNDNAAQARDVNEKPGTKIGHAHHHARVAAGAAHEVTA